MGKRKPLVDGEQLLLDMAELRERQKALERLRVVEEELRQKLNTLTCQVRDTKRKLLENSWDQRNLCCLVTKRMERLLSNQDGETEGGSK